MAVAALLDERLPHSGYDRVTILVDVSGVKGGHNAPPQKYLSLCREMNSTLGTNFPERVSRLIVYPVPWLMRTVWALFSAFLDPATANKAVLLAADESERRYPLELNTHVDLEACR